MSIPGVGFDRLESLDELIEAIEMRLDIEFMLGGIRYNISTNGRPFIAVCPDGDGVFYANAKELVEKCLIGGSPLKELWPEMEILAM